MESKGRNPYWDNLKGVIIILVVFGHLLYDAPVSSWFEYPLTIIYSFHMPVFIFISGFFGKHNHSYSAISLLKLAFAYLLFNGVMQLFVCNIFDSYSLLTPLYSFWYLPALIIWRAITPYISRYRLALPLSFLVAIMIGFWSDIDNTLALSRTIAFYPFYLAGYILPESFNEKIRKRTSATYIFGGSLTLIGLLFSCIYAKMYTITANELAMMPYENIFCLANRIIIFLISTIIIAGLLFCVPRKVLPFITMWGKNSLSIYLVHRFIVVLLCTTIAATIDSAVVYLIFALITCIVTLLITGCNPVSRNVGRLLSLPMENNRKPAGALALILVVTITIIPFVNIATKDTSSEKLYTSTILSTMEQQAIDEAITISFSGDLILMRDQIIASLKEDGSYDFSPIFEYTKSYIESSDYAIGILEGPVAGESAGYTTGNFDDGIPLELNYPDSFVTDIKNAGYDLVTTANNHILDKGYDGAMNTLDVLDKAELNHIGSYRSQSEKDNVFITNIKGVKVVFMAYTYGCNNYDYDTLSEKYGSLTSLLASPDSSDFRKCKKAVEADFARAKELNPDCIIVLPHMGTQFATETDEFQETWNTIFTELGADVILGDHAHAVQPVEYLTVEINKQKHTSLVVNCPGNFVNGYTDFNGDACSITEIYINPDTKKPFCAAVIPLYITQNTSGIYCPVPIYTISTDSSYIITDYEMQHVSDVHSLITKTMLDIEIPIDQIQERYYYTAEGYKRMPVDALEKIPENSIIGNALNSVESVCFVGDSITAGSNNGGFGWYEPLAQSFPNVSVSDFSFGGATTRLLYDELAKESFQGASLYVIAIGTNDIRYRDKNTCAMTSSAFVDMLEKITKQIKELSPDASFIFVSPWPPLDNDIFTILSSEERQELFAEYIEAERRFCEKNGHIFIDVTTDLTEAFSKDSYSKHLVDHIHPNSGEGIRLYSQLVANVTVDSNSDSSTGSVSESSLDE